MRAYGQAYKRGWTLEPDNREFEKKLWWSIERFTREQVAEEILLMIEALQVSVVSCSRSHRHERRDSGAEHATYAGTQHDAFAGAECMHNPRRR